MEFFNREYYYNRDRSKCFTVWLKPGGNVYLIPVRYSKLSLPKDQYLLTDIRNVFLIVWDEPSGFHSTITWRNNYPVKIELDSGRFLVLKRSVESDRAVFEEMFMSADFRMKKDFDYFELEW